MSATTSWLGAVCLAVSCVMAGPRALNAQTEAPEAPDVPEVRIFVFSPAPVHERDRDRARHVVTGLLGSAAMRAAWRDCAVSPCEPPLDARSVTVLIMNDQPGSGPDACGRAARAPGGQTGTVFVDLPCVRRVVHYAKRALADRAHPAAAGLALGDLLGAVIAHEVGHVFGLAHTRNGLMRARLRMDEIVALHSGKLTFGRSDAATMRAAVLRAPDTRAAHTP